LVDRYGQKENIFLEYLHEEKKFEIPTGHST
jgi:hypothetical protein